MHTIFISFKFAFIVLLLDEDFLNRNHPNLQNNLYNPQLRFILILHIFYIYYNYFLKQNYDKLFILKNYSIIDQLLVI